MNKNAARPLMSVAAFAITCVFAICLFGCTSGGSSSASASASGSSTSSGSTAAISLDKAVSQSGLSYKVSSSWTQSGNGATAASSNSSSSSASAAASSGEQTIDYSQSSFKTGEGNNALQVTTDGVAFTLSPEDALEKMRSAWIDYQGGSDWSASAPETSKLDGATRTDYSCTWVLKNGDKASVRVAFVQSDSMNATISYYYNSGDDAIFDAVMKTVSID